MKKDFMLDAAFIISIICPKYVIHSDTGSYPQPPSQPRATTIVYIVSGVANQKVDWLSLVLYPSVIYTWFPNLIFPLALVS